MLAEKKGKKKIALVLGGGGARGLSHIGAIEEIVEQGYEITSVVGTSMGALVGGIYAMGKLDVIKQRYLDMKKIDIYKQLDLTYSQPGLIKGEKVINTMKELTKDRNIEELSIPFKAIATDLVQGEIFVFNKGSMYEAIRASISLPTVFTPVKKDGMVLVDGGVLSVLPTKQAEASNNELIFAIDVGSRIPAQIEYTENMEEGQSVYDQFMNGVKDKIEEYSAFIRDKNIFGEKGNIQKNDTNKIKDQNHEKKNTSEKNNLEEIDWGYSDIVQESIAVMMRKLKEKELSEVKPDILVSLSVHNASTYDFHRANELIEIGRDYTRRAIQEYEKQD